MDLNWLLVQGNRKYKFCILSFFCDLFLHTCDLHEFARELQVTVKDYSYFTRPVNNSMLSYVLCFVLYLCSDRIKYLTHPFHPLFCRNESTPVTEVEPYIPFNINPTGMQPLLTTSYLLAFPSIMAR